MVPSKVNDMTPTPPVGDPAKAAQLRASEMRRKERNLAAMGDGFGPSSSPDGDGGGEDAAGRQQQRQRRKRKQRRRARNSDANVVLDNRTRIKRRVKNLLMKMRVDQNLLDAYSGEGWKGQSREKIRPEKELQRAEAQILHSKLAIREALHELDDLGLEGSLDKNVFDAEGRVFHEEIFCAKCKSQETVLDNDIILCDGACNRGFHQYCLDPPLATINIPPGDEGWLCPLCECKMECVEAINAYLNTDFEVENSWEVFFSKEAAVAAGGGPQDGADGDLPSSDSEDDDFDPEGTEMRAKSESEDESSEGESSARDSDEGESSEEDEDREDGENGNAGNEASASDKDEKDPSDKINVRRLAKEEKRSLSSEEGSGGSLVSDSDDSDISLVDEFNDGKGDLGLRHGGSQAEIPVSDEEAMVIGGKRQRKAVDYKRLHDEAFGNAEIDDDKITSEDEDWGPQRHRRRTTSDDPIKTRPPRVRRRRASSGDASNVIDAQGEGVSNGVGTQGEGTSNGVSAQGEGALNGVGAQGEGVLSGVGAQGEGALNGVGAQGEGVLSGVGAQGEGASDGVGAQGEGTSNGVGGQGEGTSNGVGAQGEGTSNGVGVQGEGASNGFGAQGEGASIGVGAQGEETAAEIHGEKRAWRRLPDSAVEALRLVVAVNSLPSKSRKEELATQLGLSFAQVHGWFKNQRHQALRKGLVSYKRPHLYASSSKGVDGVNTLPSEQVGPTESTVLNDSNSLN